MQQYFAAKARLLLNKPKYLIINADCSYTKKLQHNNIYTYSTNKSKLAYPGVYLENIISDCTGFKADVITPWGNDKFICPLLGEFNLENTLAMFCALGLLNVPLSDIATALKNLTAAPGRLEIFKNVVGKTVVIDYAHTPDALEKALLALRLHFPDKKIHCLFGCGGDRDQGKRALMGQVAAKHADAIILTNDNPRGEDPETIVSAILEGIAGQKPVKVEYDRKIAIQQTIAKAANSDIILVAGKGHETTQTIGNDVIAFSDWEIINKLQDAATL